MALHSDLLWNSLDSFEEGIELILKHLFLLEEFICKSRVEVSIGSDDLLREGIGIEEESSYLQIDEILCLIRDDLPTSLPSKIVPFAQIGRKILWSDLWIESESHDHCTCDICSTLDI